MSRNFPALPDVDTPLISSVDILKNLVIRGYITANKIKSNKNITQLFADVDNQITLDTTDSAEVATIASEGKVLINSKTGLYLRVPIKLDTGDPTGEDGAIYYNSVDNAFRGKVNGSWTTL